MNGFNMYVGIVGVQNNYVYQKTGDKGDNRHR